MIKVDVTADNIRKGVAGDCFRCAVSLALARTTGDTEANVYERDWTMYIEVWGRHIIAPHEVRQFVYIFDGQPRTEDDRLDFRHQECEPPEPFTFDLPDQSDHKWELRCYVCEELFSPAELDGEGICKDCRSPDGEPTP